MLRKRVKEQDKEIRRMKEEEENEFLKEAGIPIIAIKNFLGHTSVAATQRYAELSQVTVNRHIKEWNEKWFP